MKGLADFGKSILAESSGQPSTMRILVAIVVLTVLFNWTYINLKTGTLVGFDWQDLMVIVGPLIAKGYQKSKETVKDE